MFAKSKRWARANWLLILACAVVIASLLGTGALIRSFSGRANDLREAEVSTAKLRTQVMGLGVQSGYGIRQGEVSRSDLEISRTVVVAPALREARNLVRLWGEPEASEIQDLTRRTAALGQRLLRLVNTDLAAASALNSRRMEPSVEELSSRVGSAETQIRGELSDAQRQAALTGIAITGGVGVFLVVVVVGVSGMRRRQVRQEAAEENARRLQALVQHGSDMITVLSPDTTVLYEAGAVEAMLGYRPSELEGHKLREWVHPDDVSSLLGLCASANGGGSARELRLFHRDGTVRTCEARATSLLDDELWNGIVLNVWDVSERKELEERLRHQAFHDGLTGLANRALFGDRLQHALARAARNGDTVSVLLVDLDDFKSINDSLGHAAGDRLLEQVSSRLDDGMRGADTIARLGGDEFAVVIDESASQADDEAAAQRIIASLAEPIGLDGRSFPVTASVGIARCGPAGASADQLVRNADLAMYSAKSEAKGTYAVYRPDMHIATEERLALKGDLVRALADGGQLELYYQPVVSLEGEGIVGLEALLRWNHPTRGQIAPEDFIPLAEETGAIVPIGRWVLQEACRQGAAWVEGSEQELSIAVNVSARQLSSPQLVDDVQGAIRGSGMPAERLVLEVTETTLMRNVEQAVEVLRAVKRLGVKIAIDDFGTGYSSLSQLERLPVDILKIDRAFAGTPEDRAEHAKLLQALVEIGDSLHLRTVAEGIETPEQLEEMKVLHYPFGQGFLFSPPLPVSAVAAMLADGVQGQKADEYGGESTPMPRGRALGKGA
jgi:diguanylate cyclase (GGDEF)-like protein/PAS domain S-box-containing protein